MLRRLSRQLNDERDGVQLERKRSKRERISQFFRTKSTRRQKPQQHNEALTKACSDKAPSVQDHPVPEETRTTSPEPSGVSINELKAASVDKGEETPNIPTSPTTRHREDTEKTESTQSESPVDAFKPSASAEPVEGTLSNSCSTMDTSEERDLLTSEAVHALFSGAPNFSLRNVAGRLSPTVSYPWDKEVKHHDATDSVPPSEPSYMAATAHVHDSRGRSILNGVGEHQVHGVGGVETPSWMSAQGLEPGSIGFVHFAELAQADSLVTETQYDEDSEGFLETARNKGFMQTNPERIGIRAVDMVSVYDRLIELQDLYEAFQQSPERITILNNQTPGELYGHLFGTFLTPPGYGGADVDPVGLQVQILAILRALNLKGIWYDFSLVEWRIRLGQVLFSDPEPVSADEPRRRWTQRDVLLVQISLSCELLLRLDAVGEVETFASLATRKTDWDIVLARRFLQNVLVIKGDDERALTPVAEKRGLLLSMFSASAPKETPRSDIIFLPQHQTRQLSGLVHFAEAIKWPTIDSILHALAEKLGVAEQKTERAMQPASPSAWSFNPTTPSVVSVYGTPLQTPRSASHQLDDYFGRVQKPPVQRNKSSALRVPLSSTLLSGADSSKPAMVDIGGWLSRSFLTGLILPGEAMSHFLISTMLENDQVALSALGDSADLYGGFVYNGKSWWSKACIVGRVLACTEGARECMGWIHVDKRPDGGYDGWRAIRSEPVRSVSRSTAGQDMVAADSAALPGSTNVSVHASQLVMPRNVEAADATDTSIRFVQWELTPLNTDLIDNDNDNDTDTEPDTPSSTDIHTASLTFHTRASQNPHILTLTHEVHFVTSWPCYTPSSTSPLNPRHVAPRPAAATDTLSPTSPQRSTSLPNSHGFEPLLSHPPSAADPGPQPMPVPTGPLVAHPLHASYRHVIVPVARVLEAGFVDEHDDDGGTVVVLDARGGVEEELLARAWCAERGVHALVGRVGRTCVGCCVREARGLGVGVVIRV